LVPARELQRPPTDTSSCSDGKGDAMKVLVLEDHPEHREYLFEVFRSMGFRPIAAVTPDEVVHLAIAEQPDLIVLDIMLRTGDGLDAARRLKSHHATRHIPVLAVTGLPEARREECLAAGCDEFLRKPFRVHQLSAIAQALVERPATGAPGHAAGME
jgi:CheY-like chemotaxis protein